ncbi:MAG: hypothetical protein ABIS50_15120 [Luteolibacter sp.]|uniref:hypothetical protein n=1 Tax=Luteolibacter sp. TaxID=1962973 RepID=UPI0032645876
MIPTRTIRDALLADLNGSGIFEKVMAHKDADLGAALEHLRDYPSSIAVVVPGEDKFEHTYEPGTNTPIRTECRNGFELLVSARELDMREDGAVDSLTFKDQVLDRVLWSTLGVPNLVCMPLQCEPMIITFEDARNTKGREAWKITLEMRHDYEG